VLPDTFSLANHTNLQSLRLEKVRDAKLVPRILKQITSTGMKYLSLDWDLVRLKDSRWRKRGSYPGITYPCNWSELGNILGGSQFSNLLMVEIEFYLDDVYNAEVIEEARAEVLHCMPPKDGRGSKQVIIKPLPSYNPDYCSDW
jgi:hypothetical protein